MADVNMKLSTREVELLSVGLQLAVASERRAFNSSSDPEMRALRQKRIIEMTDLGRKFSLGV